MDVTFCSQCKNLTYIHRDETNKLFQVCKVCGHTEDFNQSGCIYNMNTEGIDVSEVFNTNEYITHDITLPVIRDNENIKCTNELCESIVENKHPEITYIKYDSDNMRYLYICNYCGQKWKNIIQ